MSVPSTVFIDTSIFDETAYNFEAASVEAFTQAIGDASITLLMPDPMKREIKRHIEDKAAAAVKSLEDAARRAPFIRKLTNWPLAGTSPAALRNNIARIANSDYQGFLGRFNVIELGYEGVDLQRIMNLYDWQLPPFSDRKKAEFPDAIAVASILSYQETKADPIAVISKDGDFKAVCDQHPQLLYFPSLTAFAEALNSEDERVEAIQSTLADNDDEIREAINEAFQDASFYIEADWDGEVSDPEILEFDSVDYYVVALGEDVDRIDLARLQGFDKDPRVKILPNSAAFQRSVKIEMHLAVAVLGLRGHGCCSKKQKMAA
jgi:hypothetical protein